MLIAGILISPEAYQLVATRELSLFLKTYVELNIENTNPQELDINFIANNLRAGLDKAFHTQFSVTGVDASTGEPLDDLSTIAALSVGTDQQSPPTRH